MNRHARAWESVRPLMWPVGVLVLALGCRSLKETTYTTRVHSPEQREELRAAGGMFPVVNFVGALAILATHNH